ncbi:MAG: RIO1 family regulatory kinase/ATPase, partial [Thermoplasmata archaeon]
MDRPPLLRRMPDSEELLYPTRKERFEDRRKERSDRKLLDEFFDHPTLLAISRLITQGQFEAIDYPVATGKEGGVFRATAHDGFRAIKVYRISNATFRRLPPHVLEVMRRELSLSNHARMIFAWTRREHTILRQFTEAGVRVPEPKAYSRNVLVMEFVGTQGLPS